MNIGGFLGIQLYDIEAYFAGDVSTAFIECVYRQDGGEAMDMFSGNPSKRYDSVNDVTIVSGRSAMPQFVEGMEANFHLMASDSWDIYLRA